MTLEILISIAIAIVIHEAGHYVFARAFGVHVKRVSLFFNPFFTFLKYNPLTGRLDFLSVKKSLYQTGDNDYVTTVEATHSALSIKITDSVDDAGVWEKPTGYLSQPKRLEVNSVILDSWNIEGLCKWRLTQYCLGWLPFGGYVTIDYEGSDGLLSKKIYQQVLFHLGGILFNVVTVVITVCVLSFLETQSASQLPRWLNESVQPYIEWIMIASWAMACFNLLPLPALDGYHALTCMLPEKLSGVKMNIFSNVFGLLVFVYIISTWFREPFAFETLFWDFVGDILFSFMDICEAAISG